MPALPSLITDHTVLPIIVAPMFLVSGPDLVLAACRAGVIGAFPAPNARTVDVLDDWLGHISRGVAEARQSGSRARVAPWAVNLVVHRSYGRLPAELDLALKYRAPLVITALGSPRAVVDAVHSYGGLVFADVNSLTFAHKAAEAGVDGLILVAAGAGGHTGQMAGFAFVEAVREFWDGYLVLAGGISTGRGVRAAQTLGADLAYLGTRFIAARESLASDDYRQMLVEATYDDIVLSDSFTGIPAHFLKPSIRRAGLDPDRLKPRAAVNFDDPQANTKAWRDVWSAGQGVGMVKRVETVAEIVARLRVEYAEAVRWERAGDAWTSLTEDEGRTTDALSPSSVFRPPS